MQVECIKFNEYINSEIKYFFLIIRKYFQNIYFKMIFYELIIL